MKDEIKERFCSLEELKKTIDCYDGYLDNEEVYYFIGALRFAYDCITNLQEENERLKELCDEYEEEHSTTFNEWKETITNKYQTLKELQQKTDNQKEEIDRLVKQREKFMKKYDYLKEEKDKYKNVIDKIKEYCELNKEFTPRLEDILELLEEVE